METANDLSSEGLGERVEIPTPLDPLLTRVLQVKQALTAHPSSPKPSLSI